MPPKPLHNHNGGASTEGEKNSGKNSKEKNEKKEVGEEKREKSENENKMVINDFVWKSRRPGPIVSPGARPFSGFISEFPISPASVTRKFIVTRVTASSPVSRLSKLK